MRPNLDHDYYACTHSLKRKNAPWRVTGSCGHKLRQFMGGQRYELPYWTACFTCPFYSRDSRIERGEKHNDTDKKG